jgi:hypothetical protein
METVLGTDAAARIDHVRGSMPGGGLFKDKEWRLSPQALPVAPELLHKIEALGPATRAFQRACNELYQRSAAGEVHPWVASLLDQGKPERMVALGRQARWRDDLPRVIRPDLVLTETGVSIAELDSLPGGIGVTGWLGETYGALGGEIIGGAEGMVRGFSEAYPGHDFLISRESEGYQPEMEWLAAKLDALEGGSRRVVNPWLIEPHEIAGSDIYRFFELWDLDNVEHGDVLLNMAQRGELQFTPPLKPFLEEKIWLALFWIPQLRSWWDEQLSAEHLALLRECIPFGWVLNPVEMPIHAEWPRLGIHSWEEMKRFGNKERELVIKISGWSEKSWGSRGVKIGHDLSQTEWSAAIDEALDSFPRNPYLMQRFERARVFTHPLWDDAKHHVVWPKVRARLCPYYFVAGEEVKLSGILATLVPADKKILHGMSDAMLLPCVAQQPSLA